MTKDEARTLLTTEGATMIDTHLEYMAWYGKWLDALEAANPAAEVLTPDEQYECFFESLKLLDLDPDDPRLNAFHNAFYAKQSKSGDRFDQLMMEFDGGSMN
jgi:hypothetical protein